MGSFAGDISKTFGIDIDRDEESVHNFDTVSNSLNMVNKIKEMYPENYVEIVDAFCEAFNREAINLIRERYEHAVEKPRRFPWMKGMEKYKG